MFLYGTSHPSDCKGITVALDSVDGDKRVDSDEKLKHESMQSTILPMLSIN